MASKPFKIFGALALLSCLGLAGILAARELAIAQAEKKARGMIATAQRPGQTEDQEIEAMTAAIFRSFIPQDPAEIFAYRVRPYLTNRRLPGWLRLPDGVMETFIGRGFCDNAARALSLALAQEGYKSVQWNMVSPHGAHSALLVTKKDNRKILADPFYGYIAEDPKNRQSFKPLNEKSDARFYKDFENISMAAQGEELTLEAAIPPAPVTLGALDGRDNDVKSGGMKIGLNPFWNYMGHKYNREWVRVLRARQPVKVVMTLLAPAEDGILVADPAPAVSGNILTWELQAGDAITLTDGLAKPSLTRLNSYIGIDQIEFLPM
jgi:hypothetical protein